MNVLRFYVEYHFGRRQPCLEFCLNGEPLLTKIEWSQTVGQYQVNVILSATTELKDQNCLEIWQRDKTDADLIQQQDQWIDHWCKIQEIEIDGIRCQTALYNCSEFEHSMSDQWVQNMQQQGHNITKTYRPGTDIRLNGCCRLLFTTPVWRWYITNYYHESAN